MPHHDLNFLRPYSKVIYLPTPTTTYPPAPGTSTKGYILRYMYQTVVTKHRQAMSYLTQLVNSVIFIRKCAKLIRVVLNATKNYPKKSLRPKSMTQLPTYLQLSVMVWISDFLLPPWVQYLRAHVHELTVFGEALGRTQWVE